MSAFYEDWFEMPDDDEAALWCREFVVYRPLRSEDKERRAFYKYICKRGWYEPMKIIQTVDGDGIMVRRRFDNCYQGYPSFRAARSYIKDEWYRRRNYLFGMAFRERNRREEQMRRSIQDFRKARNTVTSQAYIKFFSGVGKENVPFPVLFLADSLLRLKEVMKYKNRTRIKATVV